MTITVYVPADSAACSVGAEEVAQALQDEATRRGIDLHVVRNGTRALFWLEPLIEVDTGTGRIAYGPVQIADVSRLFDADFLHGGPHELRLGVIDEIPYLARQQRLTYARLGVIEPLSLMDYAAHEGWQGLAQALTMSGAQIIGAVTESGLRGRGGAAFPAGIKWKTCLDAQSAQKYIVCNADEGDSGTYADRLTLEGDPYSLIEGMLIAALAVGATQGYVYVRSEYPQAFRTFSAAIERAREAGYLGENVRGSGHRFELEARLGAGAYICGEETSLLESLEGRRGQVRVKPPLPAISGLFGKPTVVNNVVTLATVPLILARGATYYRDYGMGRSRGTQPVQLAGNLLRPGLVEVGFGISLRELLYDFGGGSASGRPLRAVQIGGPLGAYLPAAKFDVALDYEALAAVGGMLGHGGIVAFDDTVDMAAQARYAMEFCAIESCGKCTPCRIGSTRGVEIIDRLRAGIDRAGNETLLRDLCDTLLHGSLCALGGMAPFPVLSALDDFAEDFAASRPG
ncbi:MAG: NADH-quinone oxidoreductase subunit NuoF [Tahibacter sp.]